VVQRARDYQPSLLWALHSSTAHAGINGFNTSQKSRFLLAVMGKAHQSFYIYFFSLNKQPDMIDSAMRMRYAAAVYVQLNNAERSGFVMNPLQELPYQNRHGRSEYKYDHTYHTISGLRRHLQSMWDTER
jgi:hypothetical protein